MPATAEPTETELLVDRVFARRAEIAKLEALQEEDLEKIIALGRGKHRGANPANIATVVAAQLASVGPVSYQLKTEDKERAKAILGDAKLFKQLFDRTVIYTPCASFGDVVPKLTTPAKARDLVQLCLVPGKNISGKKAYVLWK